MNLDKELCSNVGVSAAIVYEVIKEQSREHGVPFEGHLFVRLSVREIAEIVPFLSRRTITRALTKLEEKSLVESKLFTGTTRWRRAI